MHARNREAVKSQDMTPLAAPDPFGSARWIKNQRIPHPPDFHERLVRAIMTRDPAVADREMQIGRAHV